MSHKKYRKSPHWKFCVRFWDGCCAYCGKHPKKANRLTMDHFIPRSKGGPTNLGNIVPACGKCNNRKTGISPEAFCTPEQLTRIRQYFKLVSWPNTLAVLMELI